MWCCVGKPGFHSKIGIASASPHRGEIAPSIPTAFSLEVKSKYSAIHLCCSFSKEFMFYMGGIVSKGPIVVPDSNESIHTRGLLFLLTDSSSSKSKSTRLQTCTGTHTRSFVRSEVNRQAHAHDNTFFTSYKNYMSCTLEGL